MHIAIVGASGRTGMQVLQQALECGHQVTVLVRHPEKLAEYTDRIQIIKGSATDPQDVAKAIATADVVIHTVSVPFWHTKPTHLFSQVAQAVIQARPQTQAKQYIVMSSFGTHQGRRLPRPANRGYEWLLGDVADDKEQEEALLQSSTVPRTIIKSVVLSDGIIGNYTLIPFAQFVPTLFARVSRKTVAKAILDIAQSGAYVREKVVVR